MMEARPMPHSVEAERVVLAMAINHSEYRADLLASVKREYFHVARHWHIWSILENLIQQEQPAELTAIAEHAGSTGLLEKIGGVEGLVEATDAFSASPGHYAESMRRDYLLRELYRLGRSLGARIFEHEAQPEDIISEVEEVLTSLRAKGTSSSETRLSDSVSELLEAIQDRADSSQTGGLSTGYEGIDEKLGGLRAGQLLILAARPAVGKSALALNIAHAVAKEAGPALFVSLEMSAMEQAERIIGYESQIGSARLQKADIGADRQQLFDAVDSVDSTPLMFLDSIFDLESILNKCRAIHGKHGLKLIVVDYLQLCEVKGVPESQRERAVAKMSRGFKRLAQELKLPVMALSQLNRDVEKRQNKRPVLSDLRESGAIEQDANVVLFLHRPDMYDSDDRPGQTELIVGKNRNGDTGIVNLTFRKELTRFEPASVYEGSL